MLQGGGGSQIGDAARKLVPGRRSLADPYDTSVSSLPAWTSTYANVWDAISTSDTPTFWYLNKVRQQDLRESVVV